MKLVSGVEIELKWNPELSFRLRVETFPRNANDGIRLFIERNRLANNVFISGKSALPEMVAKDYDPGTINEIVGLAKSSTKQDRCSEETEVIRCDVDAVDLFSCAGCEAHLGLSEVICGNILYRIQALEPKSKIGNRCPGRRSCG